MAELRKFKKDVDIGLYLKGLTIGEGMGRRGGRMHPQNPVILAVLPLTFLGSWRVTETPMIQGWYCSHVPGLSSFLAVFDRSLWLYNLKEHL